MKVLAFVGRRLLQTALVLVGVSLLSFLLLELAPGDFFEELVASPRVSPETLAALRADYGLDQPLALRYGRWAAAALRGDLGFSIAYNAPAGPLLLARAGNTLLLAGIALVLTWAVALPLGIGLAAARHRPADRLGSLVTAILLAVPEVVLVLGLLLLALRSGAVPVGGLSGAAGPGTGWAGLRDRAAHLVVPVAALVLSSLPVVVRHVRAALTDVLEAPYLRAARGHGIGRTRLLWRHALPAGANPVITLFGSSVGMLLGGSLLVEVVTSWPGLGPLFLEAILGRDVPLVIGAVLLSALVLAGGNLLADLVLFAVDPRVRSEPP